MSYTTLAQAKKQLNIETAFTDDDTYITTLISVAELSIREYCCWAATDFPDADIPVTIRQAALLLINQLYTNRTIVSFAQGYEIPYSFHFLLNFYRIYTIG